MAICCRETAAGLSYHTTRRRLVDLVRIRLSSGPGHREEAQFL